MIPQYPKFTKLKKSHAKEIQEFTAQFPCYSDFNFTSLYTWNVDGETEVSYLNNNLVIRLKAYEENRHMYSLMGTTNIDQSLQELLTITPIIELIPEITVETLKQPTKLQIIPDRDNFDYVLDVEKLAKLSGKKLAKKRQMANKARRKYSSINLAPIPGNIKEVQAVVNNQLKTWSQAKLTHDADLEENLEDLSLAVNRTFDLLNKIKIDCLGLYLDNHIAAFFIVEQVSSDYAIAHYMSADLSFMHVYEVLFQEVGKYLAQTSCKYLNTEQDVGVGYIRKAKSLWAPISMLKKYTVKS